MDLFAERLISGVVYFCLLLILVMTHAEAEPTTIDLGIGETYLFSTKTGEDVPITLISTHSLGTTMRLYRTSMNRQVSTS